MQKVGVEAIVEGLGAFVSDMGSINRAMDGLRPQGTLLQRMFSSIGEGLQSFGREVLNVAEVALGVLLARAIEFVIDKLKELVTATIQAGAEFQILQLRLNSLNMNALTQAGMSYQDAMSQATETTKEQLQWIQRLAIATPYDASDIANVYTMARTFGFADDMAQGLTVTVTDFTASMGLGDVEMRRILKNFGQMNQLGKITQRELNDLAVGAMVPVNDVLKRMQTNLGLTTDELDKMKSSQQGVNEFFVAFSQIVEERAGGAAAQMARTFTGATDNAQDFIKSIMGFNVVMPILDVLGGKIADTLDTLTSPKNFDMINKSAERLGIVLGNLLSDMLGGGEINADGLVSAITKSLDKLTGWFLRNGPKIKEFFKGIGDAIRTRVVPFIEGLVEKFNTIRDWVNENKPVISEFFKSLGEIISTVFENLSGGKVEMGGGLEGFLQGITDFMNLVIANKDQIAEWATLIAKVVFWFQIGATALSIFMGVVFAILAPILGFMAVLAGMVAIWTVLGTIITAVATFVVTILVPAILIGVAIFLVIMAIILMVVATLFTLWLTFNVVKAKIDEFVAGAQERFGAFRDDAATKFEEVKTIAVEKATELWDGVRAIFDSMLSGVKDIVFQIAAAFNIPHWGAIGRAIIEGVEGGVFKAAKALVQAVVRAVEQAYEAAMNAIQANSPSKLFARVGEFAMLGMAKGLEDHALLAVIAMREAVSAMSAPALGLPAVVQQYSVGMAPTVSSNITNTNNFNLTVNSGAPTEPVIADYNMMQSMIQG